MCVSKSLSETELHKNKSVKEMEDYPHAKQLFFFPFFIIFFFYIHKERVCKTPEAINSVVITDELKRTTRNS